MPTADDLPANLVRHAASLRRVARALASDDAGADDLVQGAYLAGLERPNAVSVSLGDWLKGTLRRVASLERRSAGRRQQRESSVAASATYPSASERAESLESQERLAAQVRELPELQAEALWLRFWEDLTPQEIASHLGVGIETVKSRLKRGLANLRASLDAETPGGREAWLSALAPWALPAPPVATTAGTVTVPVFALLQVLVMKKIVVSVLALFVLALSGVFLHHSLRDTDGHSAVEGEVAERLVVGKAGAVEDLAPVRAATRTALADLRSDEATVSLTTRRTVEPEQPEQPEPPTASERVVAIAGVVILHELDGTERRDLTGQMSVSVWGEKTGWPTSIAVEDGRFRLELTRRKDGTLQAVDGKSTFDVRPEEAQIAVEAPTFDGGTAVLYDEDDPLAIIRSPRHDFGAQDVVVHVRSVGGVRLNVVDAASGIHLDSIRVVAGSGWNGDRLKHPAGGWASALTEDTTSPVMLMPNQRQAARTAMNCLVSSTGYAWAAVNIDLSHGGERTVELVPGGDLEVWLQGDVAKEAVLRLTKGGVRAPFGECRAVTGRVLRFDGLEPGPYVLRVELGAWHSKPLVLATEEVTVEARATKVVTLQVDAPLEAPRATVAGVIVVPSEWELDHFRVTVELLGTTDDGSSGWTSLREDDLHLVDGTTDTFAFELGPIQTGRYSMTLHELNYMHAFELGPGGKTDVLMDVPPPVEVSVIVRDGDTGAVVDMTSISWVSKLPAGIRGFSHTMAMLEDGDDRFHLRVPRGEITVFPSGTYYGHASKTVAAIEGLQITLEVRPIAMATVRLMCGDARVPWPDHFGWKVEPIEGEGRITISGSGGGGRFFGVSEPGRYRLEIPVINGYEPHEPVDLELVAGVKELIIVELVPK